MSEPMREALIELADRLSAVSGSWLVGGSCGLRLQHIPIGKPPRDLDVYMDEDGIRTASTALEYASVDELEHSRTELYDSWLSHYAIAGVPVELVGAFQVAALDSNYAVNIAGVLLPFSRSVSVGGRAIRLMPLAHELVFNVLRGRPDRYEAIAQAMRQSPTESLPALRAIAAANRFSLVLRGKLEQLTGCRL